MSIKKERIISLAPDEVWHPKKYLKLFRDLPIRSITMEESMGMCKYDDDGSIYVGSKMVEIEIPGEGVAYEFQGDVYEYFPAELPCKFEIDYAERVVFDEEGVTISRTEVNEEDIPTLWAEALRIGVEEY